MPLARRGTGAKGAPEHRRPRRARLGALAGGVLAAAGITVLVLWGAALLSGPSPPEGQSARASGGDAELVRFKLTDRKLAVQLSYPLTWQRRSKDGVTRLKSPDRSMTIAMAAPTGPGNARQVRSDTERALREAYGPARVVARDRGLVSRRPALATEFAATDRRGDPLRILSIVASSGFRTYSLALFSGPRPDPRRYAEAQMILRSLHFIRPTGSS